MQYNTSLYEHELKALVEQRLSEIAAQLMTGKNVESYDDYKRLTGYVAAFQEVYEMMVTVKDQINKKEGNF